MLKRPEQKGLGAVWRSALGRLQPETIQVFPVFLEAFLNNSHHLQWSDLPTQVVDLRYLYMGANLWWKTTKGVAFTEYVCLSLDGDRY